MPPYLHKLLELDLRPHEHLLVPLDAFGKDLVLAFVALADVHHAAFRL